MLSVSTNGYDYPGVPTHPKRLLQRLAASLRPSAGPRQPAGPNPPPKPPAEPPPRTAPSRHEDPLVASPRIISPEVIEETDIEVADDHQVLRRLIRSELAKARDSQQSSVQGSKHRVHKSPPRRRHRRSSRYSSDLSIESDEGGRPRVSPLHHEEDTRPFLDTAARFPAVSMRYSK